jgi:hypothetical protein
MPRMGYPPCSNRLDGGVDGPSRSLLVDKVSLVVVVRRPGEGNTRHNRHCAAWAGHGCDLSHGLFASRRAAVPCCWPLNADVS